MSQVAIIIVNWNTGRLLRACLESLDRLPEKDMISQVVVVDNASSDNSLRMIQEGSLDLPLTILPQSENLGFAKANNVGLAEIHNNLSHDHILLLNPDTEVNPGALSALVSVFDQQPKAGIVGPKLIEPNGETQLSVRNFPSFSYFLFTFLKLGFLWSKMHGHEMSYDTEREVQQVMGAAFLIRNTAFADIGLLDESYWIWFEEVDYCKRAHDKGWKIIFTPTATVVHHGGVSFGQVTGFRRSLPFLQSSLQYVKKHMGILSYGMLLCLYPISLVLTIPATVSHIIRKQHMSKNL